MPRKDLVSVRRGTLAQWATAEAAGPVLLDGERGYITDTKEDVVGDGTTKVASLTRVGGNTYVHTLGPTNGTDDSTVVNAAITAGSTLGAMTVKALPGQTYVLNNPVVLKSNVTLDISGSKWTRTAGYLGPMFTNNALTPIRTTATASMSSSVNPTFLTDTTANFTSADVGRAVTVAGAGLNGAYGGSDLYTTIASVTSATVAVLSVAAVTTVSNVALSVYTRDNNIGIVADSATIIDVGTIGSGANYHPYLNMFRRVDGLTIKGNGGRCVGGSGGGGVTFWSPGDVTKFVWDHWIFSTTSGGVQLCGPARDFSITNVYGTTGDDAVALQGSGYGWEGTNDVQGSLTDGRIQGVYLTSVTTANGVKVFGGLTNANVYTDISGLVIEKIYGSGLYGGVLIQSDRAGTTNIGSTVVRDVRWSSSTASPNAPVVIATLGARDILIENIGWDGTSGTSGYSLPVVSVTSSVVERLTVRGVRLSGSVAYVNLVQLQGSNVVTLSLEDSGIHNNDNCKLMLLDSTSTITGALYVNRVRHGSTGYGIDAQGAIYEIIMSQVDFFGGPGGPNVRGVSLTKAGSTTIVKLNSVSFNYGTYGIYGGSVTLDLQTNACLFAGAVNVAIHTDTAGSARVLSAATKWGATSLMNTNRPWSISGDSQAAFDMSESNLTPVAGDTAYNTNAAWSGGSGTSKVGYYGYTGSAWTKIFGPA